MIYSLSLYISITIFGAGLIYKIYAWLSIKPGLYSKNISTTKRISQALKGVVSTIFSLKLLALVKTIALDIVIQRKVLKEDPFRWLTHILIYLPFILLIAMHALGNIITVSLFDTYSPSLNPFMFLRDLFGALIIIGVAMAAYRRFFLKAPRLKTTSMDTFTLALIAIIMVSGVLLEGVKITSYSAYKQMVEDYAGLDEGEDEFKALTAYWVERYAIVSQRAKKPFDPELIKQGEEIHETSCAACHSRPNWAFVGYPVAFVSRPIAGALDKAGIPSVLFSIHFFACLIGLAYLPFSKFLHIITTPLSLLINSFAISDKANKATRQAIELDACMHCGNCTGRCSVGIIYEKIGNVNILPSEKISSLKKIVYKREILQKDFSLILQGTCLCTNCLRCTDVCPAGINLQELWFSMREEMLQKDSPEPSILSPLSFYRGLMKEDIPNYQRPLTLAREAISSGCELIKDRKKPIYLETERDLQSQLTLSNQANTFRGCFGCQTCTNVCPVVANYEDPIEHLGMLPHQIMYAAGLGIKDLAFGSNMLWDCTTCYQCQEHCPQGVKVTDILYELKNLAVENLNLKKQILL
jgi:heterodisulfide reductase subunit C/nitrate reductase gamma subunit